MGCSALVATSRIPRQISDASARASGSGSRWPAIRSLTDDDVYLRVTIRRREEAPPPHRTRPRPPARPHTLTRPCVQVEEEDYGGEDGFEEEVPVAEEEEGGEGAIYEEDGFEEEVVDLAAG